MISVSAAREIIQQHKTSLVPVRIKLQEALSCKLAVDVWAPIDIPAFPQSSMDGYAFSFADWQHTKYLKVIGEMAAGADKDISIEAGSAVRIFTGAAVPPGADTVVMQEKVQLIDGKLVIEDELLKQGSNLRVKGSEIQKGELALAAGVFLTPAAIGFLAGMGITEVTVFPPPVVTILITGNELQRPGYDLAYGQVYDSNSFALTAVLQQYGIHQVKLMQAPDDLHILTQQLSLALDSGDIVLLTGGVSVGDYDFVVEAAKRCHVQTHFHKLKQKPGKPLFFGTKDKKLVFGLPGNPSSVLTCFYMYVLPAIMQICGKQSALPVKQVPIKEAYHKQPGLTHFLKGYYDGEVVKALGAQESYRMRSFAEANCLIEIDEQVPSCEAGTIVNIHMIAV